MIKNRYKYLQYIFIISFKKLSWFLKQYQEKYLVNLLNNYDYKLTSITIISKIGNMEDFIKPEHLVTYFGIVASVN